MSQVVHYSNFNAANLKLGNVRELGKGKMVYLSYNDEPLIMQTPEMIAPYGLSKWENDGKNPAKYTLDLSFKGFDTRDPLQKFSKSLQDFDDLMMNTGLERADIWFPNKKIVNKDGIDAIYTTVLRSSKDNKYPPIFKMVMPYDEATGNFKCKVFNKITKEEILDVKAVNFKGAKVAAIVQCAGVWLAGGKFGTTWKVVQLRVEPIAKLTDYAFRDNDETFGNDDDDVPAAKDGSVSNASSGDDDFVESDDDLETKQVAKLKI